MDEAEKKRNADKDRSSAPPGWPNMPGRSLEHDREPPTHHRHGSADSTEEQRDLERHPPK